MDLIADRWTQFNEELEILCEELGRDLPLVIAVSKTRSDEEVQQAIDLGISDFGENYPQNFKARVDRFPDQNWHFIGHLQRNKVEDVISAHIVHTLDREKLAKRLVYFDYTGECFIQVNISDESSKSGVVYEKTKVMALHQTASQLGLKVAGLMSIGNSSWNTKVTHQKYQEFVEFGHDLGLYQFSLGMSGDWQEAVRAGSTHLRIGTAIFGGRK